MLLQTLFIYTSLIAVLCLGGLNIERNRRLQTINGYAFTNKSFWKCSFFIFVYFAVLVGLRYDVGTDHLYYWQFYVDDTYERFEFLFQSLTRICRKLGFHPTIYFGLLGFIQIAFFYWAFKDESYLLPLIAVFLFTDGMFSSWMNTIRQDMACCIWIFALNFIVQKKPIQYIILCIIAFLIHRSAIFLVLLYPIFRNGKDFFHKIPVQIVVIVIAFFLKNSFGTILLRFDQVFTWYSNIVFLGGSSDFYSAYSMDSAVDAIGQNIDDVQNTGWGVVVKYLTYTCIVLLSNKTKEYYDSPKVNIIYTLFFISFIAYIILPKGVWSLSRPFKYLTCTRLIMMAYTVYYLFNSKKSKEGESYNKLIGTLILITQLGLFFTSNIVSSHSVYYHGYQLFFQH